MRMMKSVRLFVMAVCVIWVSGCGGNEAGGDREDRESSGGAGEEAAAATTDESLTPGYLAGEWCYAYSEAGYGDDKERDEENITYIFRGDGSLLYQNNPDTPVENEGSYELADGELTILPMLRFLPSEIRSVDEDGFVLGNSVTQLTFHRGVCDE